MFWRQGYEGTSLSDLTEATGLNRPSLYAAFGNKEALFREALDRYGERGGRFLRDAVKEHTARAVVERLLHAAADRVTCLGHPGGCLTVRGALACGPQAEAVRQELAARRAEDERLLRHRLERAKAEGDLPPEADPADLARYVATVYQGMSVQAAGGASRPALRRVAELALRAWPHVERG